MDYIVRNLDLYDVETSVNVGLIPLSRVLVSQQLKFVLSSQDVISAMNVNPQISFPPEVDFVLIGDLITETCKVAFAMQTLDPPLDISFASDGELYNDSRLLFWVKPCCLFDDFDLRLLNLKLSQSEVKHKLRTGLKWSQRGKKTSLSARIQTFVSVLSISCCHHHLL